jgi:hypothetical protein
MGYKRVFLDFLKRYLTMNNYQPNKPVDPQQWLDMDEIERIELVREYHQTLDHGLPEDGFSGHCIIHTIVENQIAMGVEYVPETIAKLTRQGLDRHEAVHAVGAILSEDIFEMLNGYSKEFSAKKHRRKLDKLTAKRWNKGQY